MVNAVRWHHAPEKSERVDNMLDIVHAANVLCLMAGIGAGSKGIQYELSAVVAQRLGLLPAHLEKLAGQAMKWSLELGQALAH
jgi:hypothetical protein